MAFAVAHEVPDHPGLTREIANTLKTGGCALVAEPRMYVPPADF